MSAVAQRAEASPAVLRSQSVAGRPTGSGTSTMPCVPPTSGAAQPRSPASSARQAGPTRTSSSRKTTQGVSTVRQPALRAAAGPRPPVATVRARGASSPSASSGSGGRACRAPRRSSTTTTSRGAAPSDAASAPRQSARQGRPTVGTTTA